MTDQTPDTTDRKFANTLARGLSVLRAFRASDDGLSHSELAERTGLPRPTITRLTYTLTALGYLSQSGKAGLFRPGPGVIALGSVAQASVSFIEVASERMQLLANDTGTLALIAVRDAGKMLLARTWRPVGTASIWLEPGHRIPVYGSSSGQAVLAAMTDAQFAALGPDARLAAFRQDGYAQLLGQGFTIAAPETRYASTVNAVAVPFHAAEFGAPVAFTCGALPETLGDERMLTDVGPALRDAVREIEQMTGRSSALTRRG